MPDVRIRIDTEEVRESIKTLRKEGRKAIADALNKTAFEILDAEDIEVRSSFAFSSHATQRFLSRGFFFDKATPDHLAVTVYTKEKPRNILERQALGDTVKAGEEDVGPTHKGQIAVPVGVKRGAGGKVYVRDLPRRVLRRNAKGRSRAFVAGKVVLERTRTGGVRLLYALADRIRIPRGFDFYGTAERTAREQFPRKADRVLEKLNLRRSGR